MKEYLKEKLSTQRATKTLVWQTTIVTIGGSLGLLIKALNSGTNLLEIILMITGFILSTIWFYLIGCLSDNIEKTLNELKIKDDKK